MVPDTAAVLVDAYLRALRLILEAPDEATYRNVKDLAAEYGSRLSNEERSAAKETALAAWRRFAGF